MSAIYSEDLILKVAKTTRARVFERCMTTGYPIRQASLQANQAAQEVASILRAGHRWITSERRVGNAVDLLAIHQALAKFHIRLSCQPEPCPGQAAPAGAERWHLIIDRAQHDMPVLLAWYQSEPVILGDDNRIVDVDSNTPSVRAAHRMMARVAFEANSQAFLRWLLLALASGLSVSEVIQQAVLNVSFDRTGTSPHHKAVHSAGVNEAVARFLEALGSRSSVEDLDDAMLGDGPLAAHFAQMMAAVRRAQ